MVQNLDKYEQLIEYFFNLKSTVSFVHEEYVQDLSQMNKGIGSQNLGWDFSVGTTLVSSREVITVEVYPTSSDHFEKFICDDTIDKKMKYLFDWLLPYNINFRMKKELIPGGIKGVSIGENELSYLGYFKMD